MFLGGFGAQFAGGLASGVLRAWLASLGMPSAQLEQSPVVIVPALFVSGLSLCAIALLAAAQTGAPAAQVLRLRPAPLPCYAAAAFGTVMLGPTADTMMRAAQRYFPDLSLGVVPMLTELVQQIPLYVALPAFALLPGVSEELMFRGVLMNAAGIGRLGICVSALAFAAFHIDPHHIAGVLPLGFFLAWVGARCGTLVTIVAHVINNAAAIGAAHSEALSVGYGTENEMPWQWLPASLALVAVSVIVIVRTTRPAGEVQPGAVR